MGSDLKAALRPAIVMTLLFAVLLGLAYPLLLTGIGQALFASQSNGSLVRDARGQVIGSSLIGQGFAAAGYFQGRPSAAGKGYDAVSSSGSNLGPTSQVLIDRVKTDVAARRAEGVQGDMPADLVTASGSGLDPHLSPAAARVQVARVARARNLPEQQVHAMVDRAIEGPLLGILGEDRVNVLELNLALDRASGRPR